MIRFWRTFPVRWVDIDSVGVLNNAVYLTMFEQVRYEYCRQLDLLEQEQFPFVLGETSVRYHKPGRMGMELDVGTQTVRLGSRSFEMTYEVRHDKDVLATGTATLVYVDAEVNSRPIPESARERIQEFEGL